jgi:branched-chain amino acid transport system ATP-binding protein
VRENVAIAAEHGGAPGEVAAILDAVQLTPLQDRRAGQLSVGEAKRLELARALALKPAVLLLDEPLAGLSPDGAGAVVRMIARVRDEGAAVVWVEHGFAWGELAGQLLVLEEGRVRYQGAPRDWEARRRPLPA